MATSDEDPGRRKQGEKVDNDATNLFQNDGSFLEMFKKRMEASPSVTTTTTTISTKDSNQDTKGQYDTTYFAPQTITYKKETESNGPAKKPQYQGIIGKRKSLMKTVELREKRKKRREELEEQQSEELKEQKSSAWKSYMAEVKAYESRSCGDDDDHKRPLVK